MTMQDNLKTTTGVALTVRDLSVRYPGREDKPHTIWGVSFDLHPGTITGLIGESGCGKSTAGIAAIGYKRGGETVSGQSLLGEINLLDSKSISQENPWGRKICYVSQSAALALSPALTVGRQLSQPLTKHLGLTGKDLQMRMVELLQMVRLPEPERALRRYPFQFSGGQQQRIALAIALSCQPEVLILDEPTTGLDVTTQAQISHLIQGIVDQTRVAVLYVSHDLALLSNLADNLMVMYAGQIVEQGPTAAVIGKPLHPYTKNLLGLSPRIDDPRLLPGIPGAPPQGVILNRCAFEPRCVYSDERCRNGSVPLTTLLGEEVRCVRAAELQNMLPERTFLNAAPSLKTDRLLAARNLGLQYPGVPFASVSDVNITISQGQRIGIVGESGSGKSSVLKIIAGLRAPTMGDVQFEGKALDKFARSRPRSICAAIQLIFQNPDQSLNPHHTIRSLLRRSLTLFRPELERGRYDAAIEEMLEKVRLPAHLLDRLPRDLSGGQRQRVAIARAFLAKPKLLLCDEITSALDVSVQAAVLQLIAELSVETGVAIIFVSHDLAVVRTLAEHVIVMQNGRIVEQNSATELFERPAEGYTRELLAAIPSLRAGRS